MTSTPTEFVGLCQETKTDKRSIGILTISEKEQSVRFVDFADGVPLFPPENLDVVAEDGRYLTLLGCINAGWEQKNREGKRISSSKVIANKLVIGDSPWSPESLISTALCTFDGASEAMHFSAHLEHKYSEGGVGNDAGDAQKTESTIVHLDRLKLFEVDSDGLTVKAYLTMHSRMSFSEPTRKFVPTLSVAFAGAPTVDTFLNELLVVVWFFTLSLGRYGAPRDVHVTAKRNSEPEVIDEQNSPLVFHEVRQIWSRVDIHDLSRRYYAICQLQEENELEACKRCLELWIKRREDWSGAYSHSAASLSMQGMIDKERLLAAFAWFESIPVSDVLGPLCDDVVAKIADAAVEAAIAFDCNKSAPLIRSVVGNLKIASTSDRIAARIKILRARFGNEVVPERLETSCAAAVKLRGKLAHGRVNEDIPFSRMADATFAMELVSFLSMYVDLPISSSAPGRMRGHPCMVYLLSEPLSNDARNR